MVPEEEDAVESPGDQVGQLQVKPTCGSSEKGRDTHASRGPRVQECWAPTFRSALALSGDLPGIKVRITQRALDATTQREAEDELTQMDGETVSRGGMGSRSRGGGGRSRRSGRPGAPGLGEARTLLECPEQPATGTFSPGTLILGVWPPFIL